MKGVSSQGFTLVELMVVVSIMMLFMGFAGPSFKPMIERSRINSQVNDIASSVKFARSEAIKHGRSITLCASSDLVSCTGTWSQGWILFIDIDSDRVFDTGADRLLKVHGATIDNYALNLSSTTSTSFQFNSLGFGTANATFFICGPTGIDSDARGLIIQHSGSTRYATDGNDSGDVYENHSGENFSC